MFICIKKGFLNNYLQLPIKTTTITIIALNFNFCRYIHFEMNTIGFQKSVAHVKVLLQWIHTISE